MNHNREEIKDGRSALRAVEEERDLLASCLLHPKVPPLAIARLTATHFYLPEHQVVFQALVETSSYTRPDKDTVRAHLLKGNRLTIPVDEVLLDIEVPRDILAAKTVWRINRIIDAAKRRSLFEKAQEAAEMAVDPTVENPVEKAMGMLMDIAAKDGADTCKRLSVLMHENYQAMEKARDAAKAGKPPEVTATGFYDLDKKVILGPGSMTVLAARPAIGKTALAFNVACNVGRIKPVVIFSMEMSGRQMAQRLTATESGIEVYRQQVGQVTDPEWNTLANMIGGFDDLEVWIEDSSTTTVSQMMARCRQIEANTRQKLGLVVVDYLGLADTDKPTASETERVTKVSRDLKKLAMNLGVPVLALSQLNREVEKRQDKRPTLSDLRQSGGIEQDADAVLFIYRDDYYAELEKRASKAPGIAEVIVSKNRSGTTGKVDLRFEGAKMQFYSVETWRDAPAYTQ